MCIINPEPEHFVWADSQDANLKEPIESLKKQGWKYGDVPTASNFNWLFNDIMNQMRSLSAVAEKLEAESVLAREALHTSTNIANKLSKQSDSNSKVLKQICNALSVIVAENRKHIPNYSVGTLLSSLEVKDNNDRHE